MAKKNPKEPSFEEALKKLECLVEDMENGEIPLADLVARFEEGNNLVKICQKRLADAELKIEKLSLNQEDSQLEVFEQN